MGSLADALKKSGALKKYNVKEPVEEKPEKSSYRQEFRNQSSKKAAVSANPGGTATAPYNFISLAKGVLPSPLDQGLDWPDMEEKARRNAFKTYILEEGKYSGCIDLSLQTLTPLFVGDGGTEFFSPAGRPVIPGSTLRGMVRSLFKIVTAGAMRRDEDFTDRHLYFRCIMAAGAGKIANTGLHDYYQRRMTTPRKGTKGSNEKVKNAKPGFLYRLSTDKKYYIAPCEMESIAFEKYRRKYGNIPKKSTVVWDEKDKGAFVFTGTGNNKNYVRYLSKPDWEESYAVDEKVIGEYRDDKNRGGVDLLKTGKTKGSAGGFTYRNDIDFVVPCFYIAENEQITAFGHGRSFRIPYKKSIGDRVPEAMQSGCVDFADAVFGRKEWWAGRVSFEDAELEGDARTYGEDYVKPLLQPNPTSFQLYLTQNDQTLEHWDSDKDITIRGYKMYWHKGLKDCRWQDKNADPNSKVSRKIKPLKEGSRFTSRIHFKELSEVELGALLNVFRLGDGSRDIVYKLGQGKSLGLGSVRITAALHLDAPDWYESFVTDGGWENMAESDAAPFIRAFEAYVQEHLPGAAKGAYKRSMEELALMLDWNNTAQPNWAQKTAMMNGDDEDQFDVRFIARYVLPPPKKVAESKK